MVKEEIIDLSSLLEAGAELSPDNMPDFVAAQLVVDCHCELGEGVIYDDRRNAVLWTDILGSKFHMLQMDEDAAKIKFLTSHLPKKLCSFGMLENDANDSTSLPLLCAWEDGFQLYDALQNKKLSEMSTGEDVNPKKGPTRMNDGRVEPAGKRFISGGYYGDVPGIKMKVYKCEQKDKQLVHEPIFDSIEVTNSLCWSLNGKTMYMADSPTKQINAYDYDSNTGAITGKKLLHEKLQDEKLKIPDGCTVDSEGYLWNAVWRSGEAPGMVERISPTTGEVVFTVHMPDATSQVSCCCFGGPNLDILFITTAGESRDSSIEHHAGGLYAAQVPYTGRKESRLSFAL